MQQIGEKAARVFKLLAGQDREERVNAYVFALYVFLFVIAMVLFFAWITGHRAGDAWTGRRDTKLARRCSEHGASTVPTARRSIGTGETGWSSASRR
jgi:hypothetical protein